MKVPVPYGILCRKTNHELYDGMSTHGLAEYKAIALRHAYLMKEPSSRDLSGIFVGWAKGPSNKNSMGPNFSRGSGGRKAPSVVQGQRPGEGSRGAKLPGRN